jgi:GAF domain-containing protein
VDHNVVHDRRLGIGVRALQRPTLVMARLMKVPMESVVLDQFTQAVGRDFAAPFVCLSLMDTSRRLVVSTVGVPPPIALLVSWSFMKQVVASGGPLLVRDGRKDPRMARNPVVREGTVTAYLGMQLTTTDGRAVGTLSIMDRKPRRWTSRQLELLRERCTRIVGEMEIGSSAQRM